MPSVYSRPPFKHAVRLIVDMVDTPHSVNTFSLICFVLAYDAMCDLKSQPNARGNGLLRRYTRKRHLGLLCPCSSSSMMKKPSSLPMTPYTAWLPTSTPE